MPRGHRASGGKIIPPRGHHGGGKPQRLNAPCGRDENGHPITVRERIMAWVRTGMPHEIAYLRAGVSRASVTHWFREAQKAEEKMATNPNYRLRPYERDMVMFARDLEIARAEGQCKWIDLMQALAAGGLMVETTTLKSDGTINPTTGQPRITEQVIKRETTLPSFNALKWIMDVQYGKREALEIYATEGGALNDSEATDQILGSIDWFEEQHRDVIETTAIEMNGNGQH